MTPSLDLTGKRRRAERPRQDVHVWVRYRRLVGRHRPVIGSVATALTAQLALVASGVTAARALGPQGRGQLALVVLLPSVTAQLMTVGITSAIPYYLNRGSGVRGLMRIAAPVALLQAVASVAVQVLLMVLILPGTGVDLAVAALLTCPATLASIAMQYGLALLQGRHRFTAFNLLRLAPSVLYASALLVLLLSGTHEVEAFIAAWSASMVITGIAVASVLIRPDGTEASDNALPRRRELVKFGLRGALGSTSPIDSLRPDQLLIGVMLSTPVLGLYVVASALTNLPRFIAQSIGMVAYPKVAASSARTTTGRQFAVLTAVVLAGVLVALELFCGVVIRLFFGESFVHAVPMARLLILGTAVNGFRRIMGDIARGAGRAGVSSIGEFAALVLLVVGAVPLAGALGGQGVALAQLLSAVGAVAVTAYVFRFTGVESRVPLPDGREAESGEALRRAPS